MFYCYEVKAWPRGADLNLGGTAGVSPGQVGGSLKRHVASLRGNGACENLNL